LKTGLAVKLLSISIKRKKLVVVLFLRKAQKQHNNKESSPYFESLVICVEKGIRYVKINSEQKAVFQIGVDMKKSIINISLLALIVIVLTLSFAPMPQDQTPLISIDMDALIKQIETAVNEKFDAALTALDLRVKTLEEKVASYEKQVATLAVIANMPTATKTAIPRGTLTPTAEPTRTPNPSGYDCEVMVYSPYYYGQFNRGSVFSFQVEITNIGPKTWGKEVTIQYLSGLKAEVDELYAYALPTESVAPEESFLINIPMKAPEETNANGKFDSTYALTNGKENFCEFSYFVYVP